MSALPVLFHVWSSYYSGVARCALHEKQVVFKSVIIDLHIRMEQMAPWYVRINPNMTVPSMLHNGNTLTSSGQIMQYVDDAFDGPNLVPSTQALKADMCDLLTTHDSILIEDLTMGTLLLSHPLLHKKFLSALNGQVETCLRRGREHPELQGPYEQKLTLTKRRLESFSIEGIESTRASAERACIEFLKEIDGHLGKDGWVLGDQYTLPDVVTTSFLSRLLMIKQLRLLDPYPKVSAYFERVQARPSYGPSRLPLKIVPTQQVHALFLGLFRACGLKTTDFK